MKIVYHRSSISGLKVIAPTSLYNGHNYIFASRSKIVSLIFSRNNKGPLFQIRTEKDGSVGIVARMPGFFKRAFDNSGSIYTLDGDDF